MVGLRIPPKIQITTFLIGAKKKEDQLLIELIFLSI